MLILPAIDLMDGACVRLKQGDFARATRYSTDPSAVAREFADAGAEWLHVVDLDGARAGDRANREAIVGICGASNLKVQAGGGVRTPDDVEELFDAGVARVVVGSLLVRGPKKATALANRFGADRLIAALDVRPGANGYRVALRGWQEESARELDDLISRLAEAGLRTFLVTDIARDGMLEGPNAALYAELAARYPDLAFQASGGVKARDDLDRLRDAGAAAAIVGRALYEGQIQLAELFDGR